MVSKENKENIVKYAQKRQKLLFKWEKLIAELDVIKREIKANKEELDANDRVLMRCIQF